MLGVGAILMIIGGMWILVLAFDTDVALGVASLLFHPVAIVYAFLKLRDTWKPLLLLVIGLLLVLNSLHSTSPMG